MQKIKKNKIPIFFMMILCAIVISQSIFVSGSDDEYFRNVIKNNNTEILFMNNRILINMIIALIESGGIYLWRTCNIIICGILFEYILKIINLFSGCEQSGCINFGICCLFFLIPINVLSSSVFWVTGSFNYLWGGVAGLLFLFPFLKLLYGEKSTKIEFVMAFIGGCYGGNLEQVSAIQVCFSVLILIYCLLKKRKIEKKYWILFGFSVILLCILLILPFNKERNVGAISQYYPDWYMLSFIDKIYQGMTNVCVHILDKAAILWTFFTVVMWIAICKSENLTIIKYIAAFPCVYFVINILCKCNIFGGDTINLIYNIQIYKYQDITSIYQLIPVMMVCTAIFLEAILLWFLFRKNIEIFIGEFLLYGAGIVSAFVVAFSPTIFVSGNRIFFLMDLFLTIIIGIIIKNMIKNNIEKNLDNILIICFGCGSLIICIKYAMILHGVVWY